jgi:hypothetical protein
MFHQSFYLFHLKTHCKSERIIRVTTSRLALEPGLKTKKDNAKKIIHI